MIALRLKQIAIREQLTTKEMAHKLDVNYEQLNKYMRGEQVPSATLLIKIKQAFNIDMNWFCNEQNKDKIEWQIKEKRQDPSCYGGA